MSRRCNNFGSYGWYKRRGERVDFMPGFDPELPFRSQTRSPAPRNRSPPSAGMYQNYCASSLRGWNLPLRHGFQKCLLA